MILDPRADSRSEPMGVRDKAGKKTARRAMISSRAPTPDEDLCWRAQSAAEEGDFDAARTFAAEIKVPRHRAQAWGRIAQQDPDENSGEDAWMEAAIAALRVGRSLAEETLQILLNRWTKSDRWDDCVELTKWLHDVDFTWQREFFDEEYSSVRATFEPGDARTQILDRLMLAPIALGYHLSVNDDSDLRKVKMRATWERGGHGDRLFALGIMIGNHHLALADLIVDGIRNSRSAFEQYYSVLAAYNAVTPLGAVPSSWMRLTDDEKTAIVDAITNELAGVPRANGGEAHLGASQNARDLANRILRQLVEGVEERR